MSMSIKLKNITYLDKNIHLVFISSESVFSGEKGLTRKRLS